MVTKLAKYVVAALMLFAGTAYSAGYPDRTIRMIVPYAAGGASDAIARLVANAMSLELGQPIVVENRGGASTAIGVRSVAESSPDGYTMLFSSATSFAINPHVFSNLPYKTADFSHIGMIVEMPLLFVGNAAVPAKTVPDLIKMHQGSDTEPAVATNGKSGFSHLTAAMFYTSIPLPFRDIPYKGEGAVLTDLLAGRVNYFFGTVPGLTPFVREGKLTAFAVTSTERSSVVPETPTFKELGLPVEATAWFGLAVPRGTSKDALARLSAALDATLAKADIRARLTADGSIIKQMSPQETESYIQEDSVKWRRVVDAIQAGGLKLE